MTKIGSYSLSSDDTNSRSKETSFVEETAGKLFDRSSIQEIAERPSERFNLKPSSSLVSSLSSSSVSVSVSASASARDRDRDRDPQESIEMENIDKTEYCEIPETVIKKQDDMNSIVARETEESSSQLSLSPPSPSSPSSSSPLPPPPPQQQQEVAFSSHLQDLEDVPQGRHLGLFSTIILFISRILGSGIFSITSGIYIDCGQSPFLFFAAWALACVASFGGLYVFLEMGSLVPRSGGAKVFLEFIYVKPTLLATVAFSIYSVMFGFTISNVLVFGEYLVHAIGVTTTPWRIRITGLVFLYVAALIHGLSVNHGVRVQNFLGGLKLILVGIMVITGVYVMVFPQSITGIESQLKFDHTFFETKPNATASISTFSSAVIKASFAFSGWNSVHTVSNEIKNPTQTFKIAGPVSLVIMAITYFIINLAYLKVIPSEDIVNNSILVGSILFERILGQNLGRHFLTFSIALCAGGNIFVVIYTISRVDQEVFREGYLPFSRFMSSNWPCGAPLRTLILSCTLTTLVIIGFPQGDIYSYMVSLEGYPQQIAIALIAIGIFIIRRRYPLLHAPIRAGYVGTILVLLISIYLIIGPFISKESPNPKGLESWPNYGLVGLICVLICIAYWFVMFRLLPYWGKYTLVVEEEKLSDGLTVKHWEKVSNYEVLP